MRAPEFLPVDFVIIGGGVAGLTSAIALGRVGHQVTVLEEFDDFDETRFAGGCRLAPNMTRVYYRWGMEESLRRNSVVARYVQFARYESGDVAAKGEWVPDFKVESDGEFLQMHYADLRKLLYDAAIKAGAVIRPNAKVVALNIRPELPSVTLESGEEVIGDVLIGADGSHSISRTTMLGGADSLTRKNIVMYNAAIPTEKMAADPELAHLIAVDVSVGMVASWFGKGSGVMGFPAMRNEYHIHVYTPEDTPMPFPISTVDNAQLIRSLKDCEPRLRKMAEMAKWIIAMPVVERPHIDDWLHEDGPFLVLGEAAHPLTVGSIYALSMSTADGMMLGRLFHHLHRKDQIPVFLSALSELRSKRIAFVQEVQSSNPAAMSMPAGVEHQDALKAAETMGDGSALTLTQEAIRVVFAYDPEDEADNWWVQWGLMQERAASLAPLTFKVAIDQQNEQTSN